MKIYIRTLQIRNPITNQQIKSQIKKVLQHENVKDAELSLVFASDRKIKSLNKKFLSRNHPTDVLAFDLTHKSQLGSCSTLSGEIIISIDTAKRNAKKYNNSFGNEIKLYMIHGILHLLGYDDTTKSKRELMRKKEKELLEILR